MDMRAWVQDRTRERNATGSIRLWSDRAGIKVACFQRLFRLVGTAKGLTVRGWQPARRCDVVVAPGKVPCKRLNLRDVVVGKVLVDELQQFEIVAAPSVVGNT